MPLSPNLCAFVTLSGGNASLLSFLSTLSSLLFFFLISLSSLTLASDGATSKTRIFLFLLLHLESWHFIPFLLFFVNSHTYNNGESPFSTLFLIYLISCTYNDGTMSPFYFFSLKLSFFVLFLFSHTCNDDVTSLLYSLSLNFFVFILFFIFHTYWPWRCVFLLSQMFLHLKLKVYLLLAMVIGPPSPLSTISKLGTLSLPTIGNGNQCPFFSHLFKSLKFWTFLLAMAIHPLLSSLISLKAYNYLIVGDPPPFSLLSSFSELWAFLLLTMSIHPLSFLSRLSKTSKLSCCYQWQSTPLFSSLISHKALNSFIIYKLKVLSFHLDGDGDTTPLSPFSTFSKLKFLLLFLFLNHFNYYNWCVFSPLNPNPNLLIYFFHLLFTYTNFPSTTR